MLEREHRAIGDGRKGRTEELYSLDEADGTDGETVGRERVKRRSNQAS